MKWSLPLVELSRIAAHCVSPLFAVTIMFSGAGVPWIAGCSALPVMRNAATEVAFAEDRPGFDGYSDAERLRISRFPAIPDFDVLPVEDTIADSETSASTADKIVAEEPKVAAAVAASGAGAETITKTDKVPTSVDSKPAAVASSESANGVLAESVAANNSAPETASAPSVIPSVTRDEPKPVETTSAIPGSGKIAAVVPAQQPVAVPMLRIDAPKPFGWAPVGKTTGNRAFQTVSVGDEGYRTLVVGSVAGNDPLAIELIEELARHLHDSKAIFGGFQATIIRTLNPDGEALRKVFNEKGQYVNHGFPKDNGVADANQPAEVSFLLEQIRTLKPQRVIHIRSIEGDQGVIATSSASQAVARDSADWLGFRVIKLPDVAVSGSLERHLASSGACEVLTFALPSTTKKKDLWDQYGDALQNLLMGDDAATRELARQPKQQSSANLRNAEGK